MVKSVRLRKFFLFLVLNFLSLSLSADLFASDLRGSFDLGYGGVGTTSPSGTQRNQGPMVFALGLDYSYDPRLAFGIEERRSYSTLGSLVGVTNLLVRWYFLTPEPSAPQETEKTSLSQKNISPYLLGAVGLMQASIASRNLALESDINLVGLSMTAGFGAEYLFWDSVGLRAELGYGQTVLSGTGSGQIGYGVLGAFIYL